MKNISQRLQVSTVQVSTVLDTVTKRVVSTMKKRRFQSSFTVIKKVFQLCFNGGKEKRFFYSGFTVV